MSSNIADREEALRLIGEKVRKLRHGQEPDKKHIVVFYGVAGIGKTLLLQHLKNHYSKSPCDCIPIPPERTQFGAELIKPCLSSGNSHDPLPCAFVDVSSQNYSDLRTGYVTLLEEIVGQIKKEAISVPQSLLAEMEKFEKDVTAFYKEASRVVPDNQSFFDVEVKATDVTDRFQTIMEGLIRCPENKAVLILLDNAEEIYSQAFQSFEQEVLIPLRKTRGFLVIMTRFRPIAWPPGSTLAQYTDQHELTLFSVGATHEQLAPLFAHAARKVQALTGGHPDANGYVVKMWQKETERDPSAASWLDDHGPRIAETLVDEIVYEKIMQEKAPGIQRVFLRASVVRQLEVNLLADLLRVNYEGLGGFDAATGFRYFELFGQMQRTGLLSWDQERKGWAIESAVRRILAASLRLNYPEAYESLNRIALQTFERWMAGFPEDRSLFIVESLYHHACLNVFQRPDVESRVAIEDPEEALRRYLDEYQGRIDREQLKIRLASDTELREMLDNRLEVLLNMVGKELVHVSIRHATRSLH